MRINKSFIALTSSDASVAWSNITGTPTTLSGYGITDAVPSSRTITINGTSYDLSANRSWTVADTNIYTTNGTFSANRTATMGGYSLTFTGSSITTVIASTGRLLIGGATDPGYGSLHVSGAIYTNSNIVATGSITATDFNVGVSSRYTLVNTTLTTPSIGTGILYGKNSDKKIYWKNSDGTEYDLTTGSGGTVTSVALATGTTGTDVNVSGSPITSSGTITLNIPSASATARGLVTTGTQTIAGQKTFTGYLYIGATSGYANHIGLQSGTTGYTNTGTGYVSILSKQANYLTVFLEGIEVNFIGTSLTSGQNYTLPNASGTLALTSSLSGYVPTTTTLTINDTAYDLSANRSWSIGDYGTW